MNAKRDDEPAWLKLLLERLEKLHVILRPYAADSAGAEGVGRTERKRTRPKSSRSRRLEALKRYVVKTAIDLGRELLDPTDEARRDEERCLQRYAEVMKLSAQAQEVFRLNRTEGMEHDELISHLNIDMRTLEAILLAIMLAVLEVQELVDNEGVAKKGP